MQRRSPQDPRGPGLNSQTSASNGGGGGFSFSSLLGKSQGGQKALKGARRLSAEEQAPSRYIDVSRLPQTYNNSNAPFRSASNDLRPERNLRVTEGRPSSDERASPMLLPRDLDQ